MRFAFFLIIPALIFGASAACTGQIRHAERIKTDPYLKYTSAELNQRRPERVLELFSGETPANLNDRGVAHARRLELDLAEARLNAAIRQQPPLTLPYLNLARLYSICDEPANAGKVHLRMAANRRLSGERLYRLARGLFDQGRRAESISLMNALVRQERHGPAPANWLGFYHMDLGDLAGADDFFGRSLEIRSKGGRGLYGKGLTAYRAGHFARAAEYLGEARKVGYKSNNLDRELATALYNEGKFKEALEIVEQAGNRENPELVELHGRILLKKNYRTDLRGLLGKIRKPADRRRLLRTWYGTDRPDELQAIYNEFDLLY